MANVTNIAYNNGVLTIHLSNGINKTYLLDKHIESVTVLKPTKEIKFTFNDNTTKTIDITNLFDMYTTSEINELFSNSGLQWYTF